MTKVALSIIIPVHNQITLLEHTLNRLVHQTLPLTEYQVIVVDDGSEESLRHLEDKYPFTFLHLKNNYGRAVARNRGLMHAIGERVVFLDGDMLPAPYLLEKHLQASADKPSDTVVIGYRYDLLYQDSEHAIACQDMRPDIRERLYLSNTCNLDVWSAPWQVCHTHNLSVPRQLLEHVGGFDEQFRTWGAEDTELGYRLYRDGARFLLARDAVAFHQWHPRNKDLEWASNYQNYKLFLKKYGTFDIEMFFAVFSHGNKKCINGDEVQKTINSVLSICTDNEETWSSTSDLSLITRPCAVLCGGSQSYSKDGWHIFHPSLQTQSDPMSLLGIELPYAPQSFSSVLFTHITLQLPSVLPAMIKEAFRLAPNVWLELPTSLDTDVEVFAQAAHCSIQQPVPGGRLCRLCQE